MTKKKANHSKKETPPKRRYKKPVLRRVEMKLPTIGFAVPPTPMFC